MASYFLLLNISTLSEIEIIILNLLQCTALCNLNICDTFSKIHFFENHTGNKHSRDSKIIISISDSVDIFKSEK